MKRLPILFILFILLVLVSATAVLAAYTYRATYTISENNTAAYTMLPVMVASNNQWMVDNGFIIDADALDTRVETLGGLQRPHMVTDNMTLTAVAVPLASQTNLYFTTGNSLLSNFDIIPGYDGYITTADNATIEPSANCTIGQSGYIDTTAGTSKDLVSKGLRTFRTYVSDITTGNITSDIGWGAFYLDFVRANNDYVNIPDHADFSFTDGAGNDDPFSISLWVNFDDATNNYLFSKYEGAQREWAFQTIGDVFNLTCRGLADGFYIGRDTAVLTAYQGSWVHLGATYDGSNTSAGINLYVNGVDSDIADRNNGAYAGMTDGTTDPEIGANGNGANNPLDGLMSNVKLYSVELTPAQVLQDFEQGYSSNLVAWYLFTDGVGNPADTSGNGHNADANLADWIENPTNSVTASGLSSGEYDVRTELGALNFESGNLMNFQAAAADSVNCTAIYDAETSFWFSLWFRLDGNYSAGSGNMYLLAKRADGSNFTYLILWNADGSLRLRHYITGNEAFLLQAKDVGGGIKFSWTGGTWYHVIGSFGQYAAGGAPSTGGRLRVNNWVAATSANITGLSNGGELTIGDLNPAGTGAGTIGDIAYVTVGTDNLTGAEETALYAGYEPGDETDLWYIDEGTGTAVISYGSAGNDGIKMANADWTTGVGPRNFCLYVDGVCADATHKVTVPDNANDWVWVKNNVMPYSDNISISVNGAQVLLYEPTTFIIGDNLPDLAGASQNGTFTWGANPSGVTVALGSMVSSAQPAPGFAVSTPAQDILPEVEVSDWFTEPDVSGTLLTNPMRPFVTILSDSTDLTERQAWVFLAFAFILMVTVATARAVRGHHFITGIAGGASLGAMVYLTIFPLWALVFIIGMVFAGLKAERTPSL